MELRAQHGPSIESLTGPDKVNRFLELPGDDVPHGLFLEAEIDNELVATVTLWTARREELEPGIFVMSREERVKLGELPQAARRVLARKVKPLLRREPDHIEMAVLLAVIHG